jgi:hypothetical protein
MIATQSAREMVAATMGLEAYLSALVVAAAAGMWTRARDLIAYTFLQWILIIDSGSPRVLSLKRKNSEQIADSLNPTVHHARQAFSSRKRDLGLASHVQQVNSPVVKEIRNVFHAPLVQIRSRAALHALARKIYLARSATYIVHHIIADRGGVRMRGNVSATLASQAKIVPLQFARKKNAKEVNALIVSSCMMTVPCKNAIFHNLGVNKVFMVRSALLEKSTGPRLMGAE